MSPQVTCTSALPGKTGNTKIAFFTRCISALPEFNQLLLDFFNLFDSRLILTMLYDSLNLVINAFSLGLLWGMVQVKGSRECCKRWTVLNAQCSNALSSGFPLSQGNAGALDRWGGKTKHRLIPYFLSDTCQKLSQLVHVCQDYTKSKVWRFLSHSVGSHLSNLVTLSHM